MSALAPRKRRVNLGVNVEIRSGAMTHPPKTLSQRLAVQERELGFNASVSRARAGRRPSGQLGLSAMRMMRTAVLVAIGMSGVGRAESLPIQAKAIGIGLESYPCLLYTS